MRLSDIKDDQALDTLADIIEPVAAILADEKVKEIFRSQPKLKLATYIIKNHKKEVVEIMARLDGEEPENYSFNILTLPLKLMELLNDPALVDLFTSQGQKSE